MEKQKQIPLLKDLLSNLDSILSENQNKLDKSSKRLRDNLVIQIKTFYPEIKFQLSNYKKIRKNINLVDSDRFNQTQNKMKKEISQILYKDFINLSNEFINELDKIISSYETVKDEKLGYITVKRYLKTLKQQKEEFKEDVSRFTSNPERAWTTVNGILKELSANNEYVYVKRGEETMGRVDIEKIRYVLNSRMNAYEDFNNFLKEIVSNEEYYTFLFGESFKEFYGKIEELFSVHINGEILKSKKFLKLYLNNLKELYNNRKKQGEEDAGLKELISNEEVFKEHIKGKDDVVFMNIRKKYLDDFAKKAEAEFNKKKQSDPEFKVILEAIRSSDEKATVNGVYDKYDAEDYFIEERMRRVKKKDYKKWNSLRYIEKGSPYEDKALEGIRGEIKKVFKAIYPYYSMPE